MRASKKNKNQKKGYNEKNLSMTSVEPKTENQKKVFDSFYDEYSLMLHGVAGTGKTFLALYLALKDQQEFEDIYNVTIVRSVVPTKDMGFLPGSEKEKTKVYEAPYTAICSELYGRVDAYEVLKQKDVIRFLSTSFIRGITLNNTIIVVDECQNLTFHELDSIMTRIGENTRIIFCGDFRQSDLWRAEERQGIKNFMRVVDNLTDMKTIEFYKEDIVRSKLVKDYIISKLDAGILD